MNRTSIAKYACLLLIPMALFAFNNSKKPPKIADAPGLIEWTGIAGWTAKGDFTRWEFKKAKVPGGDFENVQIEVVVDMNSVNTENKDLENHLRQMDYFGVKKFPLATITIDGAMKNEDGSYSAMAQFTIREITQDIAIDFTVEGEEAPYTVKGSSEIQRKDFDISGDGPKNNVPLAFEVTIPAK